MKQFINKETKGAKCLDLTELNKEIQEKSLQTKKWGDFLSKMQKTLYKSGNL